MPRVPAKKIAPRKKVIAKKKVAADSSSSSSSVSSLSSSASTSTSDDEDAVPVVALTPARKREFNRRLAQLFLEYNVNMFEEPLTEDQRRMLREIVRENAD